MFETIEDFEYRGYKIDINIDEMFEENPLDLSDADVYYRDNSHYVLGNKTFQDAEEANELYEQFKEDENYEVYIVHAYIHSGIALSLQSFNCPFDAGRSGFIVIPKNIGITDIEQYALDVLDTFEKAINGEVFCYAVKNSHDEVIDACGGIYGIEETEKMAKEMVDEIIVNVRKKQNEKLKELIRNKVPILYRETQVKQIAENYQHI